MYIKLEDCKDGNLYKINSRNLSLGIFIKEENGFVGIRQKFGQRYLFIEYHWDTGAPYGTVKPQNDLGGTPFGVLPKAVEFGEGEVKDLTSKVFQWLDQKLLDIQEEDESI